MADDDWLDCQQCLAGQHQCCARLLKRYEPDIARQMWRFTRNRNVCEELMQEVMIEAYTSLSRYRPAGVPFAHWLRRIATRVGYRYWRQQSKNKNRVPLESINPPAPSSTIPEDPAPAANLLHSLLARLPAADRLVLTLMYFESCSVQEIAQRTSWNQGIIKMRAHRARLRLKKIIEHERLMEPLSGLIHGNT